MYKIKTNILMKSKNITLKIIFLFSLLLTIYSCKHKEPTVEYSLGAINSVPDSLKSKQRLWVTETIKAASQNMTGGDYEDVDDPIDQAWITSERLFQVETLGLIKKVEDEGRTSFREILPKNMTNHEKKVMINLINTK